MYDQDLPARAAQELWLAKCVEVIDKYRPDFLWMENDLEYIGDYYKRAFLTYGFDKAAERKQDLVVSYKRQNLPPGSGLVDLEQGHFEDLTYYDWITDTTIDSGTAWGYMEGAGYKSGRSLIHYLIDNVSKNGYMLLNIGPKSNGEIPEEAKTALKEIGAWLEVNGEAIYGTMPWVTAGVGPTVMEVYGEMSELHDVAYQAADIRFTLKNDVLYATCLGEVGDRVVIPNIGGQFYRRYLGCIKSISLLGDGHNLNWKKEGTDIVINTTGVKVQKNANVFKIQREPSDYFYPN
jgi:alpha-L-fucosidase